METPGDYDMKNQEQGYLNDDKRVQRAARNLAKYLGDLLETMSKFMAENEPVRNRILADVTALLEALPERDRGAVLSAIAVETQRVFTAAGSPKVGISGDCVGAEGGGITATEGNVTVKGCVIGTLASGPQGGGAEVSVKY
jgi:hypothetical protein